MLIRANDGRPMIPRQRRMAKQDKENRETNVSSSSPPARQDLPKAVKGYEDVGLAETPPMAWSKSSIAPPKGSSCLFLSPSSASPLYRKVLINSINQNQDQAKAERKGESHGIECTASALETAQQSTTAASHSPVARREPPRQQQLYESNNERDDCENHADGASISLQHCCFVEWAYVRNEAEAVRQALLRARMIKKKRRMTAIFLGAMRLVVAEAKKDASRLELSAVVHAAALLKKAFKNWPTREKIAPPPPQTAHYDRAKIRANLLLRAQDPSAAPAKKQSWNDLAMPKGVDAAVMLVRAVSSLAEHAVRAKEWRLKKLKASGMAQKRSCREIATIMDAWAIFVSMSKLEERERAAQACDADSRVLALEDQVRSLRADLASSRAKHERSERVVGRMEAEALAMRLVICEVRDAAISEGARREELERELEETKRDADRTISEMKRDADRTISEVKRDADRIVSEAKMDAAEAAVQCVWLEENLRSSACRGDMGDRAGVASSGPLPRTDVSRADLCHVTTPSPALHDFEHVTSLVPDEVEHVTSFVPDEVDHVTLVIDEVDHVPPPVVVLADLAGCSAADHEVRPLAPRREIQPRPVCLAALEDATPSPSSTPSSPSAEGAPAEGAAAASAVAEPALAAATESKANARAIFLVEQPEAAGAGSREGWQSCGGSWGGSPGGGSAWGADSEVGQDGSDSFFSCGSRVPSP